jgi:hypothetical protein
MRSIALVLLVLSAAPASAQDALDDWTEVDSFVPSPESWALELRVGMYTPINLGDTWGEYFGSDLGPMIGFELHYMPLRVRYLGMIGGGIGLGWAQWEGRAVATGGGQGESNTFEVIPLNLMVSWRFDTFARELDIPIVLTPKVGLDIMFWNTGTGGVTEGAGVSIGPRFAGKVSLELDFLEPRAARQLDEEWGVNHSEIFFELYYSMSDLTGLPVSGWGWSTGIGLTF